MDKKIKHLEMIQAVIQRMANNSFQLKGWAVTLVGIIGALSTQDDDKRFFLLAFIPIIAFWGLDSFYLQLERKFTTLYKNVAAKKEDEIDFSMDIRDRVLVMDEDDEERIKFWNCALSRSEAWFYGSITVGVGLLTLILQGYIDIGCIK